MIILESAHPNWLTSCVRQVNSLELPDIQRLCESRDWGADDPLRRWCLDLLVCGGGSLTLRGSRASRRRKARVIMTVPGG